MSLLLLFVYYLLFLFSVTTYPAAPMGVGITEAFCTAYHEQVSQFSAEPTPRDRQPFALMFTTVCNTWRESMQTQTSYSFRLESKWDLLGVWQPRKFIVWHLCSCCPNLSLNTLLARSCLGTRSWDSFLEVRFFSSWHTVSDLSAWGQQPQSHGSIFSPEELYVCAPRGLMTRFWGHRTGPVSVNGLDGSE